MAEDIAQSTVQIDARVADAAAAERAAAEAWESGACGIEERRGEAGAPLLRVWVPAERADALRSALEAALGESVRVGPAQPVEERDWSQAWREGLEAVRVSERLVVRPSFADYVAGPDEHVLVVDPAQAFGTGHHASTRLAVALLDAELGVRPKGTRVLDVGTGSGVLVLAALVLGAGHAVGFDVDPLAGPEAQRNARANGLAERARFYTGPIDALGEVSFDVVVANLIRRELLPLLDAICTRHLSEGGALVLSGLLASDRVLVEAELARRGFRVRAEREEVDGGDAWVGLVARAEIRR